MRWCVAIGLLVAVRGGALEFPGPDPGPVSVTRDADRVAIGNRAIAIEWRLNQPGRVIWHNRLTGQQVSLPPTPAVAGQSQGPAPRVLRLAAAPGAARPAEREPGYAVEVASADGSAVARTEARDGDNTVRATVRWQPAHRASPPAASLPEVWLGLGGLTPQWSVRSSGLVEVAWLAARLPGVRPLGQVDGSPLGVGNLFCGVEDPHGHNTATGPVTVVGRWSPAQLSRQQAVRLRWPLPPGRVVAGPCRVRFHYTGGVCRLDVWEVRLLRQGRVVATDRHHGWAGTPNSGETYLLDLPTAGAAATGATGAEYTLEAEVGTDFTWEGLAGLTQLDSTGEVEWLAPDDQATCTGLATGAEPSSTFVVGAVPPGQMRRGFLYYLERYRAHPYRPFLHYNSWYDLAWDPFALNEANCLDAMRAFAEPLSARGVTIDSFVLDDGWDDPRTLWGFHGGFPHGFAPHAALAARYGARVGTWLSPFGGYGSPKEQRLAAGRTQGFGTNATGFSLADAAYYRRFRDVCLAMVRDYGVNSFKFDGIAGGSYVAGPSGHEADTLALQQLMTELHRVAPATFVNFTTGSWPSPFWLLSADSLWRQGEDTSFAGSGPPQQRWLTYRDGEVLRNIVRRAPLFPLNSLMSHGVAWSRHGNPANPAYNSAGLADDIHAFFGSGTALQELYIQPGKLSSTDWDVLAEAARWSRANVDVLVDTHWVGGDPGALAVYGWACWSPRQAIVTLRNPSDRRQDYVLELTSALELPPTGARRYRCRTVWGRPSHAGQVLTVTAGQALALHLEPFEVLTLEGEPLDRPTFDTAHATR